MHELTIAEYMELVQGEGLLIKSMAGNIMSTDGVGSEVEEAPDDPEDEEEEADDDDPTEDEDDDDETEEEPTEFTLTISTNEPDRIQDVLNPMGCVTDNFAKNPLFLFEHGNSGNGPMTDPDSILGKIKGITMDPETKSIRAYAKYFPREGNKIVNKVLEMERKGLIPGNSIGWMPLAGIKLLNDGTRTIEKWELFEVSKVIIPVNGSAISKRYDPKRSATAKTTD